MNTSEEHIQEESLNTEEIITSNEEITSISTVLATEIS